MQHLRPPRRPRDYHRRLDRHLTALVNLGFLSLVLFLTARALQAVEGIYAAAFGLAATVLYAVWLAVVVATGRLRRRAARDARRHEQTLRRWQALYYCDTCGGVFAPGSDYCITPRQVQSALQRQPGAAA